MPLAPHLPDIPDPPVNHRLRTLTVLATAAVAVASVALDSFNGGPVAQREHVFTRVRPSRAAAPRRAAAGAASRRALRCVRGCEGGRRASARKQGAAPHEP